MIKYLAIASVLGLGACTATQLQEAQTVCQIASATAPVLVAIAKADGSPVAQTDLASANLAATCAAIGAIPVTISAGVITQGSTPVVNK